MPVYDIEVRRVVVDVLRVTADTEEQAKAWAVEGVAGAAYHNAVEFIDTINCGDTATVMAVEDEGE